MKESCQKGLGRNGALDGIRALSILLVLGAHLLPLGPKVLMLNYAAGAMGMALFFVLSGFLIVQSLMANSSVFDFLVRRATRILPLAVLYLCALLLFSLQSVQVFFWSLLFTINYRTQFIDSYNAHFWSLCVEVHFYLLIALAVALVGRRAVWLVVPAALAVTLLRVYQGAYIDIRTHLRVDEILVGASVACLMSIWKNTRPTVTAWLFMGALGLLLFCSHPIYEPTQYLRPYAAGLVLLAALHIPKGFLASLLNCRTARYIAEISFALYVVHPITAQGWMNEGSTAVRYLLKRPVSFVLAFALAHFSTFYWEKPWTNWAKKKLKRRGG